MRYLKQMMFLAAVLVSVWLGTTETKAEENTTILNGISIGNVDVSGMNSEEAMDAVKTYMAGCMNDEITFHINGNAFSAEVSDFDYRWANQDVIDQALNYGKEGNIVNRYKKKCDLEHAPVSLSLEASVDEGEIEEFLEENGTPFNQRVQEYGLTREDGEFVIIEARTGVSLDLEASTEAVVEFMSKEWAGGEADVDLIVTTKEPETTRDMVEAVTDVLGAGSTVYGDSSSNRMTNIENGTSKINGTLLYPGESLSVVDACTPFSESNGYKPAGSFESGTVVETYGGGICQVSTTLYLAVMRSELHIDRRYSHSMRVSYVKPSMDAAIAEGSKDFEFTNNTDYPIYIEGTTNGWEVAFTIYGKETRDPNREVKFVSETLDNDDPDVELKAKLWKIVTIDGEETKTEFNHSTYYKKKEDEVVENTAESSDDSDLDDDSYDEASYEEDSEESESSNEDAGIAVASEDALEE